MTNNEVAVAYFTSSTNATFELFNGSTIILEPTGEVSMWDQEGVVETQNLLNVNSLY